MHKTLELFYKSIKNEKFKLSTMNRDKHILYRLILLGTCLVMLLPIDSKAQYAGDTITGRVHSIEEVTVKGRRSPQSVTAGSPLQSLKKSDIEKMGISEIADAIRHFSGISVKDYGGIGGLKTVSVRSLGAQHTGVIYDGIAISDCQSGQVDISRFSLDNLSSLVLNIGQGNNIYQSAKMFASAGTLSIESSIPEFKGKSTHINASLKAGSYGLVNPSMLYSQKITDKVSMSVYANYLRADGNYPFKMWNDQTLIDSKRNNSDINSFRSEINLYTSLTSKQDLKVKLYLFDSERGLPGGVIYDNPYAAERLSDRNYFGQINYENRFSSKLKLQLSGKFNYSWNKDYNNQSSGITDDRFTQRESYLSAVLWNNPIEHLSFSVAQDFSYNNLSTTLVGCQYPERFTYLTALAANYNSSRLNATASLLSTYITEKVETGVASADRKKLSPSISVSWRPFNIPIRLRASYKDIFRTPTFNDLYYMIMGNSKLKSESTRQFNFGTTFDISSVGIFNYITISADGYYNIVKDKIVAVPTMFVWKMMNLGKVETIGADINVGSEIRLSKEYSLYINGTYNYMQAEDITNKDSKIWRNQIIYTPKHSGSGALTLQNPYVNISYNMTFTSERYSLALNSPENRIKPYTDHSISLSHIFKWKDQSLRIQLDAQNLSNKNYEIVRFYPMPGRNYKITINYNL